MMKRYAEEVSARGFGETGYQAVCLECILDDSLRAETRQHLEEWECTFCGATADEDTDEPIAAPFEEFMNIIMDAVRFLYRSPEDSHRHDAHRSYLSSGFVIAALHFSKTTLGT